MSNSLFDLAVELLYHLTPAYLSIYLTMNLVRESSSATRLISSATILGLYALLKNKLENPTLLLEVIINVISLLVAKRDYTFLEFIRVATIYIIVRLISSAFKYLIIAVFDPNETLLTIIISLSIVLTAFSVKVVDFLTKSKKSAKKCYSLELLNGKISCKAKGYLDTGNMLYEGGKPVVIISAKMASSLALNSDREIAVSTISGIKILKGGEVCIKIFLDKKSHKVLRVVYAISDKMYIRGYDVLLHKDMEQI